MDFHPAERLLRQACALESYERFHRVSYLLLAHAVMDRRLVSVLVGAEITRRGGTALMGDGSGQDRPRPRGHVPGLGPDWMRAGEVAGLQWQDFDLERGTVMVQRTS